MNSTVLSSPSSDEERMLTEPRSTDLRPGGFGLVVAWAFDQPELAGIVSALTVVVWASPTGKVTHLREQCGASTLAPVHVPVTRFDISGFCKSCLGARSTAVHVANGFEAATLKLVSAVHGRMAKFSRSVDLVTDPETGQHRDVAVAANVLGSHYRAVVGELTQPAGDDRLFLTPRFPVPETAAACQAVEHRFRADGAARLRAAEDAGVLRNTAVDIARRLGLSFPSQNSVMSPSEVKIGVTSLGVAGPDLWARCLRLYGGATYPLASLFRSVADLPGKRGEASDWQADHVHDSVSHMPERCRFNGGDFSSPAEWLRAETEAERLDLIEVARSVAADRLEAPAGAWTFGLCRSTWGRELLAVFPGATEKDASGHSAWFCVPELVADATMDHSRCATIRLRADTPYATVVEITHLTSKLVEQHPRPLTADYAGQVLTECVRDAVAVLDVDPDFVVEDEIVDDPLPFS